MTGVVALSVLALLTTALAVWSMRLKRRIEETSDSSTYLGIKFGSLHVVLVPLAGVFALVALLMAVNSLVDGGASDSSVDDGCGSVELALAWLSSDDPADRESGVAVATEVWDRSATDDVYSIALRQDCPVEVVTMLDLAGLPYNP